MSISLVECLYQVRKDTMMPNMPIRVKECSMCRPPPARRHPAEDCGACPQRGPTLRYITHPPGYTGTQRYHFDIDTVSLPIHNLSIMIYNLLQAGNFQLWSSGKGKGTAHPLSEVTNILLTSFLICSHWLTQSQKEADIYYLFTIGWHTIYFSSYWLSFIDLTLLHMSRLRWKLVLVEN